VGVPNGYTSAQVVQAVPVPKGIVQVVSTTLTTTFSGTATLGTFMAVTGLTLSITPTSASNKILLLASINVDNTAKTQQGISAILTGGNTADYRGVANGTMQRAAIGQGVVDNSRVVSNMNFNYLDSPATTSAITYGVSINYVANGGGTQVLYVNRGSTYDDVNYGATYASTITAFEVIP
jgi:hypothetical protein